MGASLFYSAYNYSGNDRLSLAFLSENQWIFGQGEAGFEQKSRGFYGKLSAAYKEKKLELGVTLDLPYLETSSEVQYNLQLFSTSGENSEDQFTVSQFSGLQARHKVPLGVNTGAGYAIGKNKLHLNIDWHAAIDAYQQIEIPTINISTEPPTDIELIDELKNVLNFGVGTEIDLSPSLVSHLSFTTDYSPVESSDDLINTGNNLGEANILALDNYHFGGGFIIKTSIVELSLGMVYTIASETFERVISRPIAAPIESDGSFRVDVDRWRFLIAFNIPVAN
ncbi:hypothetical protein [Robertkochia aurantiaca]|uniref:hypothetical protein n=1 Tax=Robertkochia aurantiaca TaxID=2873700 RepID=UPI001CCB5D92|nr:hypothetical protein [Robertkochia sp. 3YJGBD-33]